jgi:hypothetical protein
MVERIERAVDPVIEAYKAGVDRTLIARNLKLTPEQRLLQLMELIRFAEELRSAGKRAAKA